MGVSSNHKFCMADLMKGAAQSHGFAWIAASRVGSLPLSAVSNYFSFSVVFHIDVASSIPVVSGFRHSLVRTNRVRDTG